MLRDFDSEQIEDREFKIGGEVFKVRYPHWTDSAKIWDESATPSENGDAGDFSFKTDTEFAIKRIPIFLDEENDAHNRFKQLVARKKDPIPRHQIVQTYRFLVQVTSGLPTNPPSDSGAGGGSNDSSSEVEGS